MIKLYWYISVLLSQLVEFTVRKIVRASRGMAAMAAPPMVAGPQRMVEFRHAHSIANAQSLHQQLRSLALVMPRAQLKGT